MAELLYKGIVDYFKTQEKDGAYEAFPTIKVARRLLEYAKLEDIIMDNPFQKLGVTTPKSRKQAGRNKRRRNLLK